MVITSACHPASHCWGKSSLGLSKAGHRSKSSALSDPRPKFDEPGPTFTSLPYDADTRPHNDEDKVKIDRVIEEIVKLIEQPKDEELGFNQEPVTSKFARNRPERKPI